MPVSCAPGRSSASHSPRRQCLPSHPPGWKSAALQLNCFDPDLPPRVVELSELRPSEMRRRRTPRTEFRAFEGALEEGTETRRAIALFGSGTDTGEIARIFGRPAANVLQGVLTRMRVGNAIHGGAEAVRRGYVKPTSHSGPHVLLPVEYALLQVLARGERVRSLHQLKHFRRMVQRLRDQLGASNAFQLGAIAQTLGLIDTSLPSDHYWNVLGFGVSEDQAILRKAQMAQLTILQPTTHHVLQLRSAGASRALVAAQLGWNPRSVLSREEDAYHMLGAEDFRGAVAVARAAGLVHSSAPQLLP